MTDTAIDPTKNLGDDATATFESDPKFTEPTPGSQGSSDNVEEQKTLQARDTDDIADSEEEIAEEDDVDEDEDEDEEFDDDEEDEEDDDEDEEDEDLEDDQDEVAVAPQMLAADGDDGDDDAGDVAEGVDEDALEDDDLDTDRVAAMAHFASQVMAARTAVYGAQA